MHGNKKLNQNNRGFTLIELIITVVILALVTAPFLSSFVTAGNTNVKSKRIQEANELSQYIIEKFKASDIDKLAAEYSMSPVSVSKPAPGGGTRMVTQYTKTLSNGNGLPDGYGTRYTAEITMEEKFSVINDNVIPVLEEIKQNECVVFANSIYEADSRHPLATKRDITVDVSYDASVNLADPDAKPYIVSLTVAYDDGTSTSKTVKSRCVPNLYILYTPKSVTDTIKVKNNLTAAQLRNEDGTKYYPDIKLNTYIIQQSTSSGIAINENNVSITETEAGPLDKSLFSLINGVNTISYTTLYTNIGVSSTSGDLNAPMKTIKITALYDLTVTVKYAGKEISTFNATKYD